jgi:signal transduction histidine kinase
MAYLLLLPYALFRWGSGREAAIGATIIFGKIALAIVADDLGGDAFAQFAIAFAVMAVGGAFRYRAGARQRELDRVKLLERERLARDLHDTVAHHVSAIAIRAQAGLATAAAQPDAATEALGLIETEASRTLTEMRTIVRALRRTEQVADPVDLAPWPHVADLAQLAEHTGAGPSVDVEISGDLDDLAPSVSAALYRLAQESVTNARRHARHATLIEVSVTADDTSVRLRVSDDGDGDGDAGLVRPTASPGYGLASMIERAKLLGGTCEAGPGPDPGRGWTVTAVLPRTEWAE